MDLRGIANSVSTIVNPNIEVTVQTSDGFTVGAGFRQIPSYNTPVTGPAQLQAMEYADLKQLDGLNIQGVIKAIYLYGSLAGVVRPDSKGGDLITIASPAATQDIGEWLVVKVLENWPTWTKAAIVKQGGA
jgi:hypothetical protein